MTMKPLAVTASLLATLVLIPSAMRAQAVPSEGPVGPSPYDIVRGWQQPFAGPGFAFGGNSGVFAESPDRVTEEVAGRKNWALTRAGAGPDYQPRIGLPGARCPSRRRRTCSYEVCDENC